MEKKNLLKGATAFLIVAIAVISMTGCYKNEGGNGNAVSSGDGGNAVAKNKGKEAPRTDFAYSLTEDGTGIVIDKYTGNGGEVVIPALIEGYPVVHLYHFAFQGRGGPGNNITSVVIPASVKEIGMNCFRGINSLKSVIIKGTGVKIDLFAFGDDINLEVLNIPDGDNVFIPINSNSNTFTSFVGCKKLPLKTRARLVAMGFDEP